MRSANKLQSPKMKGIKCTNLEAETFTNTTTSQHTRSMRADSPKMEASTRKAPIPLVSSGLMLDPDEIECRPLRKAIG